MRSAVRICLSAPLLFSSLFFPSVSSLLLPKEYRQLFDENKYILSGAIKTYELKKKFNIELPEGDYETLSGYLIDKLGRIPDEDEHPILEDSNLTYKVEEIDDKRIKYVKICRNMNEQQEKESNEE